MNAYGPSREIRWNNWQPFFCLGGWWFSLLEVDGSCSSCWLRCFQEYWGAWPSCSFAVRCFGPVCWPMVQLHAVACNLHLTIIHSLAHASLSRVDGCTVFIYEFAWIYWENTFHCLSCPPRSLLQNAVFTSLARRWRWCRAALVSMNYVFWSHLKLEIGWCPIGVTRVFLVFVDCDDFKPATNNQPSLTIIKRDLLLAVMGAMYSGIKFELESPKQRQPPTIWDMFGGSCLFADDSDRWHPDFVANATWIDVWLHDSTSEHIQVTLTNFDLKLSYLYGKCLNVTANRKKSSVRFSPGRTEAGVLVPLNPPAAYVGTFLFPD